MALNSPPPGATIADIVALFANKFNLTAKDVAVLSGTLTLLLLLLLLFSANTFFFRKVENPEEEEKATEEVILGLHGPYSS